MEMKCNAKGFTILEIVVVLVLISIIAAAVFTRSITTDDMNLISQTEKIKNHIRYAQSMAMKQDEVWGIFCNGSQYWLFNGYKPADVITGIPLPGENNSTIVLDDIGVSINVFSLYYDKIGKPYLILDYDNPADTQAVTTSSPMTITITSEENPSLDRKLSIIPETGLVVAIQ
jgi:prepilin-type N-terminal cleavage/methylation domain-containing protein